MIQRRSKNKFFTRRLAFIFVLCLDVALFLLLVAYFGNFVIAVVGHNTTVSTLLTVGTVTPQIISVTLNGNAASVDLNANSTSIVILEVLVRDYNGEADITNVSAEFFDVLASSYGGADDNNRHYSNSTCFIDASYGTAYEVNATCRFHIQYYSNNATWNGTVRVTDNSSKNGTGSDLITVNSLLALGVPDSINYGIVNETEVSFERIANVTNFGNIMLNLSLEGYARSQGDNLSMNCSLGDVQNISVGYQKFNLTASNNSLLSLTQFTSIYTNLTGNRTIKRFNLNYRQNDTNPYIDDTNSTYWRIYVPFGVAGTCTGNIIFGATLGSGS